MYYPKPSLIAAARNALFAKPEPPVEGTLTTWQLDRMTPGEKACWCLAAGVGFDEAEVSFLRRIPNRSRCLTTEEWHWLNEIAKVICKSGDQRVR